MANLNWKNHFTNSRLLENPDITSEFGPNFWKTLFELGVDFLNADNPKEVSLFFSQTINIRE